MTELFIGLVIVCCIGIVLLTWYLITALLKQHALRQLYADGARDFRFVCELLRLFTNKEGIVKNPCLLRSYGDIPPRADAVVVGGGGLLLLTVVDAPGQYSTPASGNWSVWQDGEVKQIPNAFLPGKQYASVLSSILMKNGISCPVVSVVVLTDDHAHVDSLYEENVLTADKLVPYVQSFAHRRALGRSGQAKLIKAIKQHHEHSQRKLSAAMVGNAPAGWGDTGEFSRVTDERASGEVQAEKSALKESAADDIFTMLMRQTASTDNAAEDGNDEN